MTPEAFLNRWKQENIDSGTQSGEVDALSGKLLVDAEHEGIDRRALEAAAGNLQDFITGGIRDSIQNELR